MAAKKKAASPKKIAARPKKKAAPPKRGPRQRYTAKCPDKPCDLFEAIKEPWARDMKKWACEVERCYETTCGTDDIKDELKALCEEFAVWSRKVKVWADKVEDCFQNKCHAGGGPPDHTPPPPPPF
jgi:hypothetical protein